jgi:thiol-disulfide isomerase/thioredoxin
MNRSTFLVLCLCAPALAQPAPAEAVLDAARAKGMAVAKARAAHIEAGKNSIDFKGDVAKDLAEVHARLATETRPPVRHALLVAQLFYLRLGRQTPTAAQLAMTLKEVPATSSAWTLEPGLLALLGDWAPGETAAYLAEARANHPDGPTRRTLLFEYFNETMDTGGEWKPAYESLQKDFPASEEARRSAERVKAELRTAPGLPAPPFTVASLDGTPISLDTFKGSYVLVDFWATWCPDCRAGMPGLHKAFARFKPKGLALLSLSFDRKVEHIAPYRANPATAMPWHHAFLPQGFRHPVSEAYGVKSIPKAVLVGPDGRIVASGGELHGANLEPTLERFLGK